MASEGREGEEWEIEDRISGLIIGRGGDEDLRDCGL